MKSRLANCSFVNELGREIYISVLQVDQAITVKIAGPDSAVEHEITTMEAQKLCSCLAILLRSASA